MSNHGIDADLVPAARRGAYEYMRHNAPAKWADMMKAGVQFLAPDEVAALPVPQRAARLATAEADRLAHAQLYYLDVAATRVAASAGAVVQQFPYVLTRETLPSQYGMVVWAEDVSASVSGIPVIACHWQARADDVWTVWWCDHVEATRLNVISGRWSPQLARRVLQMTGVLEYERERVLPFGVGVLADGGDRDATMDDRVYALTCTTVATWRLLAAGLVPSTDVEPTSSVRKQDQAAGIQAASVVRAAAAAGVVDPDAVWRQH